MMEPNKCAVMDCSSYASCYWQPTRRWAVCFEPGEEHRGHLIIPLCAACRDRVLASIQDVLGKLGEGRDSNAREE